MNLILLGLYSLFATIHAQFYLELRHASPHDVQALIEIVFKEKIILPDKEVLVLKKDAQSKKEILDLFLSSKQQTKEEPKTGTHNKIIATNYIPFSSSAKESLEKTWTAITAGEEGAKIFFLDDTNQLLVRGAERSIQVFEEFIRQTDKKPKRIKLDFIFIQAQQDFNMGFGINWSGIYNKTGSLVADKKPFGFAGMGGTPLDIPTPTQPISPEFGNLYVNPLNFAINLFNANIQNLAQLNSEIAQTTPALQLPVVFGGPDLNTRRLNLVINANEAQDTLKVIARPSLIANEREVVKMFVGQELPYYTKIINSAQDTVTNVSSIKFNNVGTSIQAEARVLDDDQIELSLYVEIAVIISGSVDTNTSGIMINPPQIEFLKLKSVFIVDNGATVMLSGAEKNESFFLDNSIPYLDKLPLIGFLFNAKAKKNIKKKEILFVTPTIIDDE